MPIRSMGVVLLFVASLCAQTPSPKPQKVFTSNNPVYKVKNGTYIKQPLKPTVAHPIPIPPRVLELVRKDPLFITIVDRLTFDNESVDPQHWLMASAIELGCTRGVLVVGHGRLRHHSSMSPFWIFAANDSGEYQPLLAIEADRVKIEGRGKSCRELRTSVGSLEFKVQTTSFRLQSDHGAFAFVRDRSWEETPPWIRPSADAIRKPPPDIACPHGSSGHYPECKINSMARRIVKLSPRLLILRASAACPERSRMGLRGETVWFSARAENSD